MQQCALIPHKECKMGSWLAALLNPLRWVRLRIPYNYSDMSGFVTLSTTKPAGFWDLLRIRTLRTPSGAGLPGYNQPRNSAVVIEVRAANLVTELPSWPFVPVGTSGAIPAAFKVKGRYLEVRVTLMRDFVPGGDGESPELCGLSVQHELSTTSGPQIISHPEPQVAAPGQSGIRFSVSAIDATGYDWFKDGISLDVTSSELILDNVQAADAGTYFVRVSGSGCTLESRAARLHVKGNAPTPPDALSISPATPAPGDTVTFYAETTVTSAASPPATDDGYQPVSFQWRRGFTSIPGASGLAVFANGKWAATLVLPNVQACDSGQYSVVFYNAYGKTLSPAKELSIGSAAMLAIAPAQQTVQDENEEVRLTATYCDWVKCVRWYHVVPATGVKTPLPSDWWTYDSTSSILTIQPPITCDELGTSFRRGV